MTAAGAARRWLGPAGPPPTSTWIRPEELAALSAARAAGDRDQAYARLAVGWVHAYRREEAAALGCLDQVIGYARDAAEPWLEASAWQARGLARARAEDAFGDWQQALSRYAAAGDMMHTSNVRYMLAQPGRRGRGTPRRGTGLVARVRVIRGQPRLPARAGPYPSGPRRVRAQARPAGGGARASRWRADRVPPGRRLPLHGPGAARAGQAPSAGRPRGRGGPAPAGPEVAMLAGGGLLRAQVLASLAAAAAAAGDLTLAARALGALDALGQPRAPASTAGDAPAAVPAGPGRCLAGARLPHLRGGRPGRRDRPGRHALPGPDRRLARAGGR